MEKLLINLIILASCGTILVWWLIHQIKKYEIMAEITWRSGVKTEAGPFKLLCDFEKWRKDMFEDEEEGKIKQIDYYYRIKSKNPSNEF